MKRIKPKLQDVPETMLWTLHNRAVEAMRADGIIKDNKAIEIYKSIDYDYIKSFGNAEPSHAVRSLDFDKEVKKFLDKYPDGTVVNLGEGLETQRFRIDAPASLWISIDLPESISIREQFIKADEQHLHLSLSVLDKKWFDYVPKDKPVFITAQGLLMYLPEEEIKILTQNIISTFDNVSFMFDTIPKWFSNKTMSKKGLAKTKYYTTPKMPWGINRSKIKSMFNPFLGSKLEVLDLGYSTFPRGIVKYFFTFFNTTPLLKNLTPSIVLIKQKDIR